jgi:hypothetical protein
MYILIVRSIFWKPEFPFYPNSALQTRDRGQCSPRRATLRAGRSGIGVPTDGRVFYPLQIVRAGFEATQPPLQLVRISFLCVKRPGSEAGHSSPSKAKVKNGCTYASTPSVYLLGVESGKFKFYLYQYSAQHRRCWNFNGKLLSMKSPSAILNLIKLTSQPTNSMEQNCS